MEQGKYENREYGNRRALEGNIVGMGESLSKSFCAIYVGVCQHGEILVKGIL